MNILLVPDKFKGSLTNREVISALKKGINKFNANCTIYEGIVSDGGDGFLNAIKETEQVETVEVITCDPLRRMLSSYYLYDKQRRTAYIELANTSGLTLLSSKERNPLKTSTYGTGLQIKDALLKGAKKVFVGLGGSATNDGGIGIANALGYRFFDKHNQELDAVGENLIKINRIDTTKVSSLDSVKFYAVNDVKNPLFGPKGAAYTYAKQKGSNDEEIVLLDKGLKHLSTVVKEQLSNDMAHLEGAGAAGGAAYGLKVFLDANFIEGAEYVLLKSGAYEKLEHKNIDLIITGEGRIDNQTAHGKLILGIRKLSKEFNVPAIAICGQKIGDNFDEENLGLKAIIEVADPAKTLEYNMENAAILVENDIFNYLTNKADI